MTLLISTTIGAVIRPCSSILAGWKAVEIHSIKRRSITTPSSQTVVATHPKTIAAQKSVLQLDHISGSSLTFPVHNSGILPGIGE
ncbi:uncharacterized protein EI90DRAFT_3058939 [Cantharellus anzutake]|uniref:uncharacterized protein n=1 Tax=Cantharellus anzutake TaxID=1750568 RepID=UPI001905B598|nr:uncharacterized protein EI90DRAFT_3058939 [Cantharellus anzutake]KAF8330712.1 hypothetical protein EI90DRAFT_3058939 [Cantharellus anzutake]